MTLSLIPSSRAAAVCFSTEFRHTFLHPREEKIDERGVMSGVVPSKHFVPWRPRRPLQGHSHYFSVVMRLLEVFFSDSASVSELSMF